MKPGHIAQLWTIISLFLFYYAFNTWLVTQGGQPILDVKLVLADRVPAAVIGILVCTIALGLASLLGGFYARRTIGGWYARLPVVGLKGLATSSREGQIYQLVMAIVLVLLPVAALIHFWNEMLKAPVVAGNLDLSPLGHWDWSVLGTRGWDNPAQICTNIGVTEPGGASTCLEGATFLPGFQPTAYLLLTLVALALLVWHVVAVFTRSPAAAPETA